MNQKLIPDPFLIFVNNLKQYVLICHPYVTRMCSHVNRMSLVCTHVIHMSLVCTRMSSLCHPYVLVCGFTMNPLSKNILGSSYTVVYGEEQYRK